VGDRLHILTLFMIFVIIAVLLSKFSFLRVDYPFKCIFLGQACGVKTVPHALVAAEKIILGNLLPDSLREYFP